LRNSSNSRKPSSTTTPWPKSTRKNFYKDFKANHRKASSRKKARQAPDYNAKKLSKKNNFNPPKWSPALHLKCKNNLKKNSKNKNAKNKNRENLLAGLINTSPDNDVFA
jgi:hypothetical protein